MPLLSPVVLSGTVEMKGNSFVFKAGSAETSFTYPVTMQVDMTITDYFYFDFTATGGWDIKWASTALNKDVNPGLSSDFGNHFGLGDGEYGNLLEESTYAPGDVEIQASGAYTWNDNLPDDGMVTMKSIEVRVGAGSELTLNALYFGDMDAAEAVPVPPAQTPPRRPPPQRLRRRPLRPPPPPLLLRRRLQLRPPPRPLLRMAAIPASSSALLSLSLLWPLLRWVLWSI